MPAGGRVALAAQREGRGGDAGGAGGRDGADGARQKRGNVERDAERRGAAHCQHAAASLRTAREAKKRLDDCGGARAENASSCAVAVRKTGATWARLQRAQNDARVLRVRPYVFVSSKAEQNDDMTWPGKKTYNEQPVRPKTRLRPDSHVFFFFF